MNIYEWEDLGREDLNIYTYEDDGYEKFDVIKAVSGNYLGCLSMGIGTVGLLCLIQDLRSIGHSSEIMKMK